MERSGMRGGLAVRREPGFRFASSGLRSQRDPTAERGRSFMVKSAKKQRQPGRVAKRASSAKWRKPARRASKPVRAKGPTPKPVVIDVHAHVLVPDVVKLTYAHSQYSKAVAGPDGMPELLFKRMTEMPLRLREMDATGVDIQIIRPSIMQQ